MNKYRRLHHRISFSRPGNVGNGILWGKKPVIQILSMVVGLIVCYAMGTIWFMVVYTRTTGAVGIGTVLGWCVIPFIIPDLVKIALAFVLSRRVRKLVPMQ